MFGPREQEDTILTRRSAWHCEMLALMEIPVHHKRNYHHKRYYHHERNHHQA